MRLDAHQHEIERAGNRVAEFFRATNPDRHRGCPLAFIRLDDFNSSVGQESSTLRIVIDKPYNGPGPGENPWKTLAGGGWPPSREGLDRAQNWPFRSVWRMRMAPRKRSPTWS